MKQPQNNPLHHEVIVLPTICLIDNYATGEREELACVQISAREMYHKTGSGLINLSPEEALWVAKLLTETANNILKKEANI